MSVKIISTAQFEIEVLNIKEKLVVVNFFATWCGPCKQLAPILDEVAREISGKALILKIDIDNNSELAQEYNVQGVPTLIFFKDGSAVKRLVGAQQKNEIVKTIQELI